MSDRPDLLVPLSATRFSQARLNLRGTRREPLLMVTPRFKLPAYWWWQLSGFVIPATNTQQRKELLRQARSAGGPEVRPVFLDLSSSDVDAFLGILNVEAGTVEPGEAAPFVSWVLETESLHPTGWHVSRELGQMLTEPVPDNQAGRQRFAWEVRHVANLLISALFDDASGWMWLNLGEAVAFNWPRNRREKQAIATLAEQSGQAFRSTLHEIAQVAAMEAARDLQENDKFRLDPRANDSAHMRRRFMEGHDLPLPDLARAFQSRAVRYIRHRLFPSPLPEPDLDDLPGALSPLSALEATHELHALRSEFDALRAIATPRQADTLDALIQAINDGHEDEEACRVAAQELGIAPSTIRSHRRGLREKLEKLQRT